MSNQVQVAFYLATPIPPNGIKAQSSGDAILVSWGDVLLPDLNAFLIYKYKPGEKPERIGTVSSDKHHFMDEEVTKGELYFYYVTSQNSAEIEGQPSAAVAARY
jgi:hypothetical protein